MHLSDYHIKKVYKLSHDQIIEILSNYDIDYGDLKDDHQLREELIYDIEHELIDQEDIWIV